MVVTAFADREDAGRRLATRLGRLRGVQRFGSVGLPLPGCAVRVAGDREVEVQGFTVFRGYWQDPRSSAEAFDGRWLLAAGPLAAACPRVPSPMAAVTQRAGCDWDVVP